MFGDFESQVVRVLLGAIAQHIALRLPRESQTKVLRWIELLLETWKLEQADADGTIEVLHGPFGMLGIPFVGLGHPPGGRVPVANLKPEQCAPATASAYDLLIRLDAQKYPGLKPATDKVGIVLLGALLVQRDHRTMPLGSLAAAAFHFHMTTEVASRDLARQAGRLTANEARRAKQRADARSSAVLANARAKRYRAETVEHLGVEFFQTNPNSTNSQAAAVVHAKVTGTTEFRRATRGSIKRMLAGTRRRALESLTRNPP